MTGFLFQNFDTPRGELISKVSGGFNHCLLVEGGVAIESMGDVAILPVKRALERCEESWLFSTGSRILDRAAFLVAREFLGIPYDPTYDFDGLGMFCSKLLWHALCTVGHPVPEPILIRDLNWRSYARELVIEGARYGLSLEQVLGRSVVTPKQLADVLTEVDYLM